jgi:TetR/AcrR family transcriptional regulator
MDSEKTPGKPRKRAPRASSLAVRAAILTAAVDAFATHGFDRATTYMIAANAGIDQGLLAYHFPSKELLWREVIRGFAEEEASGMPDLAHVSDDTALSALAEWMERAVRWFVAHPALARLLSQEYAIRSARLDWMVEEIGRPGWVQVREAFVVVAAQRRRPVDPAVLYFSFLGAALMFAAGADSAGRITDADLLTEARVADFIAIQVGTLAEFPK